MNNLSIEIYQAEDGSTQVEVRFENDTVWPLQMALHSAVGQPPT